MARRVLYIHPSRHLGGSQISMLTLMRYLDPDRYVPTLLVRSPGPYLDRAREHGIKADVHDFPWFSKRRPWVYARSILRLARMMVSRGYALAHVNSSLGLRRIKIACRVSGVPYVVHVRDARQPYFGKHNLNILNRSQGVIANSRWIAKVCEEQGVRADLVRVVYNPIEWHRFAGVSKERGLALRRSWNLRSSDFLFGVVGRIEPIKGQDIFIGAAARVIDSLPSAHFFLVGDARREDYASRLRELASSRGVASRVRYLGFRHDVAEIMKALDVLVVPSRDEPFGRVVVEGMAAGCPVLASAVGGIPETVVHGDNGLMVPPGDAGALAGAMVRLAHDPELRARLADEGQRTAQDFGALKHAERIEAVYDEVLEGG